jgi:hypothetical protein
MRCIHSSIFDRSLFIGTGHPGIGKTRGALAYTLQELLWRGEAVIRVGYKDNNCAYLFLPGMDDTDDSSGTYSVWRDTAKIGMTRTSLQIRWSLRSLIHRNLQNTTAQQYVM